MKNTEIRKVYGKWQVWVMHPLHMAGVFDSENEAIAYAASLEFYESEKI